MAEVGDVIGHLKIDTTDWQRGLQQAQQQLAQFQAALAQQVQQSGLTAAQLFRAQTQASAQAAREQLQAHRQAFQEQQQAARLASNERIAAARAASQAEILEFRRATEAARQAFQEQHAAARAATAAASGGGAGGLGTVLSTALGVAGGLGIATTLSGLVSGLKDVAAASLQAAARLENLRAQFTALQGAAQAGITLQGLFQTAQRLGIEFGTLATSFRQFDAATRGTALEGDRARRVFEQITTGMRGMGTSSEQVGRALLALQQMVSKGQVSQEELRQQLGEALPGAMGIAARAFGVTTAEMNRMIEKGMEATSFVQTFAAQVEREFGGKAAVATNTLTAAWQRFRNELEQFQGALAGSALVATLRDLANGATSLLETIRKLRTEREREAGGAAPALPRDAALSPALQQRQTEIDRLARRIDQLQNLRELPGLSGFLTPMIERMGTQRRQLITEQQQAAERFQRQLLGEGGAYEGVADPLQATEERMVKIVEEGQRRLREIDLQATFLDPLELAEQKTQAWAETTKKLGEEWNRIGEGLRRTLIPTGRSTPFDAMIERIAGEKNLDPNLMRALVAQESNFDPRAVSRTGAMGLMQLMPGTARQLGVPAGREFDPETNLRAGMTYFAQLLQQFRGDVQRALTAYNAGPGRGGMPLSTGENATFAQDVLRRMPQGPAGVMAQGVSQQKALEANQAMVQSETELVTLRRQQVEALEQAISRQQTLLVSQREGQEAAEHFSRAEATRLQESRLGDRLVRIGMTASAQIARDEQRLQALQVLATQVGAEVEAARVEAMRPQLESQLQRINAFLERPGQSAAERAQEAVLSQGKQVQADLLKMLDETARHPALRDLHEALQNALSISDEQIRAQAQKAFEAVDRQMREQIRGIDDQVNQIGLRVGAVGTTRLEAALSQVRREFDTFAAQLRAADEQLQRRRLEATPEARGEIDTVRAQLAQVQEQLPAALEVDLRLKTEDVERQMRDTLRGVDDQLDQLGLKLGAAGVSPVEADIVRLRREFERMLDALDALDAKLQRDLAGATEAERAQLTARRQQIAALRLDVGPGLDMAIAERRDRDLQRERERVAQTREGLLNPGGRESFRMRQRLARGEFTEAGQREAQAILEEQEALEDVIHAVEIWRDLSYGVGSAWVTALSSIADGTRSVSEAFREMGRSIMKTMADIAAQQAFQAIFQLGVGLLTGMLAPTITPAAAGASAASAAEGSPVYPAGAFFYGLEGFQHGGVINAPTMALVGEGPQSTLPEYIMNNQQMNTLLSRSGSGQGPEVSIHNYPSRAEAEAGAARDRAQGHAAIVNEVLGDIAQGSGSKIGRALRLLQQ